MFRSQMAAALFKKFCKKYEVESAGTLVSQERVGQMLKERSEEAVKKIIEVMKKEEEIDISEKIRTQLVPEMVDKADKIICLAEKENCPDYLLKSKKVIYWNVDDDDGNSDYRFFVRSKNKIKKLVKELVKEVC
jgi:protein-tyrosine-phosphatase